MSLKLEILELRKQNKSYSEIAKILNCSKSTVSYHCSLTTKNKVKQKSKVWKENFKEIKILNKTNTFTNKNTLRLRGKTSGFSRGSSRRNRPNPLFGYKDVINKFGLITNCYLTGTPIDLISDDYHFDHIIPHSRGGSNDIGNLGITTKRANESKGDMTVEEYIKHCKTVLENFGYKII